MCDACATLPPDPGLPDGIDADRMWLTALALEAEMPGPPAPAEAWEVFRGRRSGAIAFPVLARLAASRRAALDLLTAPRPIGF